MSFCKRDALFSRITLWSSYSIIEYYADFNRYLTETSKGMLVLRHLVFAHNLKVPNANM